MGVRLDLAVAVAAQTQGAIIMRHFAADIDPAATFAAVEVAKLILLLGREQKRAQLPPARLAALTVALASLYVAQHRISAHVHLLADAASTTLARAPGAILVAIASRGIGIRLTRVQWYAAAFQGLGLLCAQWDPSAKRVLLSAAAFAALALSVAVSIASALLNGYLMQRAPSPQGVNALMYSAGAVLHLAAWGIDGRLVPQAAAAGAGPAFVPSASVALSSTLLGLAIARLYRWGDPNLKMASTAGNSVATSVVAWLLGDAALDPVRVAGTLIVAVSILQFAEDLGAREGRVLAEGRTGAVDRHKPDGKAE